MNNIKFELNRLERNCSNEDVINEIQRVADLIESPAITRNHFDKYSKISSSSVVKRFNGWGNALNKAGLGNRYVGLKVSARMRQQNAKKMTDDDLLAELRKIAKKTAAPSLTMKIFNEHSSISAETIRRRFGSWWTALNKAELTISNRGKRYNDEDYYENLLTVWTSHGRQPKYKEMDESPSVISAGAYESKWGSWRKALLAFLDRVNSDVQPKRIKKPTITKQSTSQARKQTLEPRTIPLGLRYDVLKRDNFKCVLCGDSPAVNPKCRLQVDHFKPFSKEGKTEKHNLRSLCLQCNQGKSDKIE